MPRWYIPLIAFVGGAAVLAIEILGTRILGPFYGVTLFLWTALITTALVALSAGYTLGGRWADRGASTKSLAIILALAGAWTLITPWITPPILRLLDPLSVRLAALTAAFVLFVPSLTLLGMVSPIAIRLQTRKLDTVGSSAGNLYALSTIGSVFASILTGFYLIPYMGVVKLTLIIGVILIAAGFLGLAPGVRSKGVRRALMGLIGVGGLGAGFAPLEETDIAHGLIAVRHSAYAEIHVVDYRDRRHLVMDGLVHSLVDTASWRSVIPYTAVVQLASYLCERPGNMLCVGLGAGSVLKDFHSLGWQTSAVEIDPVVVDVAREYFGITPEDGKITITDGRQYFLTTATKHDLILCDAFGSGMLPFHLVTTECFGLMKNHLNTDGVIAVNIITGGWDHVMVRGFCATLKNVFPHVVVLPAGNADGNGNVIVVASESPISLKRDYHNAGHLEGVLSWMDLAWNNRFLPDLTGAPIMTDDLNQVETWTEEINLSGRRDLHEYFAKAGLDW